MDPKEQQTTHSYPNADRGENYNKDLQAESKPLVHMSDIAHKDNTESDHKISAIHTFKDDVANETSKDGFSISKIVLANQKNKNIDADKGVVGSKKNPAVKIIIILFVAIVIVVGFAYIGLNVAKTPDQIQAIKNPTQKLAGGLIYSEQSYEINIKDKTRTQILAEITKNELDQPLPNGKMKSFSFVYKEGTSSIDIKAVDFLDIVAPGAPDIVKRNIKDNYVFGYYGYETSQPFIILKSSNYDSTFAGMLDWERGMYADLGDLIFKKDSITKTKTSSTSTIGTSTSTARGTARGTTTGGVTTKGTTAPSSISTSTPTTLSATSSFFKENKVLSTEYETPFLDKVIKNSDSRVLYRPNGNIAFFYTLFNKDTIIITVSDSVLSEIIYRLTSGQITR